MTPLGYALLVLGALCGYLVWRKSRRLLYSIFAAVAPPMIVLAAVRVFVAQGALESIAQAKSESILKTILLLGVIVGLCVVVYVFRQK